MRKLTPLDETSEAKKEVLFFQKLVFYSQTLFSLSGVSSVKRRRCAQYSGRYSL